MHLGDLIVFLVFAATILNEATGSVSRIEPSEGSFSGGTRITIHGSGFSKDQFSFGAGNEGKGNQVTFVNDEGSSVECDIHKDGCTEEQIMCYTRSMKKDKSYKVHVKVDGAVVPDPDLCPSNEANCKFTPRTFYTPTIDSISPQSGKPGDVILTMHGRIITTRRGDNTITTTNGVTARLLRVYCPQTCQLFKEQDVLYGLSLDSEDPDEYFGTLIAKPEGSFIGVSNVSFLIEAPFGRSFTELNLLRVSRNDEIYTVQYYTDITSLSATEGSTEGGALLTVHGSYFETSGEQSTYAEAEVYVGGEKCIIEEVVKDSHITCRVPAQPQSPSMKGNRGALVESWNSPSFSTYDAAIAATEAATSTERYDESKYCGAINAKWTRMKGVFEAPHDGKYLFYIKAEHGGKLSVQGQTATSSGNWAATPPVMLTAGSEYPLTAVGKAGVNAEACVHVKVLHMNSKFTHKMTGQALPEQQKISLRSTVETEQFTMAFSGFSASSSVKEVQKICISGSVNNLQFGLYGVFTAPVEFGNTAAIKTALEKLPFLSSGETFTVVQAGTNCIDITFNSDRGDIPDFETKPSADTTVTETTKGVSNNQVFALQYNGSPSPLLTYKADGATFASEIENAMKTMFGVQCPAAFTTGGKVYESFEAGPTTLGVQVTSEVDAFCGRYSVKNYAVLYPTLGGSQTGFSAALFPYLCFATRDLERPLVRLKFKKSLDQYVYRWKEFTVMSAGTWNHTCVNILGVFSDTTYQVVEARVAQNIGDTDYYIDNVYISQKPNNDGLVSMEWLRLAPAYPNSGMMTTMEDVTVTYDAANANFAVELAPHDCGYNFDLVTLTSSQLTGSNGASSMSLTSQLTGKSGSLVVSRTNKASKPLQGTITVGYSGQTSSAIDVEKEDEDFKTILEGMSNINTLNVDRTVESTCANMDIIVEFDDMPGDIELMTIASSSLTPSDATATIAAVRDGFLAYDPIPGDLLSTLHSLPQVSVFINKIPAMCALSNYNCPYSWSSASTPTVTGVDITQGNSGDVLTITGTLFSTTPSDNNVTIGGIPCTVSTATATQIRCTLGSGPLDTFPVKVNVAGKGFASGSFDFTYTSTLSSINPTQSSLGGNIRLTLTGTGFAANSIVKVGTANCPVLSVTVPTTIVCTVPPYSDLTVTTSRTEEVSVTMASVTLSQTKTFTYTYDAAQITSVTPEAVLTTHGGQTITIVGTSLGTSGSVVLGGTELTVVSRTETEIIVRTPQPMESGRGLKLIVEKNSNGAILNSANAIPTLDVALEVTNLYPTLGSLYGGTPLTITGVGFGTDTDSVAVFLGDIPCDVSSVTYTEIQCDVADSATVHEINNEGTTGFGVYFAFSQKTLTVSIGDKVQWSWTTPEFVNDVSHGVYETATLTSTENKAGGIGSGPKSRNGQFTWRFTKEGTYYFWSGYADSSNIKHYRMTVTVVASEAWKESLAVYVANQEAAYITNSGVANPTDGSCASLATTDMAGCTLETIADPDASKFNFLFTACRSPTVTAIDFTDALASVPRSGTMTTELSISGEGFWTQNCANRVKIGECACIVSSSAADLIKCTPDPACKNDIGVLLPVSVNVNKYGSAIVAIATLEQQSIAFVPLLQSLTPASGSSQGGTRVTLSGLGLDSLSDVAVTFDGIAADCTSVNPLVCTSPLPAASTPGVAAVGVSVNKFDGVCESTCSFTYDSSVTPTLSSATPGQVSGPTTLTLRGTKFGSDNSKVTVTVGEESCTGLSLVSDTELTCAVSALPAGSNPVSLLISDVGYSSGTVSVTGTAVISTVTPGLGSIHGGTEVTFTGHGFVNGMSVTVSGANLCSDINVISLTEVTCVTVPHAAGVVSVQISSNGVSFPSQSYEFATAATPTVSSITPNTGSLGTGVVLAGQNFGSDAGAIQVTIGGEECTSVGLSGADVTCNVGLQSSGSHLVLVQVAGKGLSNSDKLFQYSATITGISPNTGDELGNQLLTVSGSGFSDTMQVTVCDLVCAKESVTTNAYTCITPPGTGSCNVKVIDGSATVTATAQYTYQAGVAPTITSVTPARGGTGGNTAITITGTGFSNTPSDVTVTISGVACVVGTSSTTEIQCHTGAHAGSLKTKVTVTVNNVRATSTGQAADFYYVDVWSSPATWGNGPIPGYDEMVVIPKGQTVMLDMDTQVLAMLLVEGTFLFDDKDVTFRTQRVLVNNGGHFQVGTRDRPFANKAVLEFYGHHRDEELPIYGTKVLAVRNGTLDLHGLPLGVTWTKLGSTAAVGATQIVLQDAVEGWKVDDEIVIASTGGMFSTGENEMRKITAISADKRTLTLDTALEFKHLGASETYNGPNGPVTFDFRAEVGLLSRNVVVRGNSDPQWENTIKACPAGFNPGEFITQSCFEGRFGEEMGNSKFGFQIMANPAEKDTQIAQLHLSYVELTYGGQAFRLGRYPVHFHLNGDMSQSYVTGCGIHHTFNRAINIHGSHNINIKDNVVFHVMGGSLFLEDGIETNNTYERNLVVMPISSSSLLNEDITPAAFWITNPDNTYIDNAAAGGTHFGYWYRMNEHPDGPSLDRNICPRRVPLRKFLRNSAHSFSWFGIWVFPEFFPQTGGACSGDTGPVAAKIEEFRSWHNQKGVEGVDIASLQLHNCVLVANRDAGYEGKRILHGRKRDTNLSAMLKDCLIVGRSNDAGLRNADGVTKRGIVVPFGDGFQVHNTKFLNFDDADSAALGWTKIDGTCTDRCGGYNYQLSGLQFENVQNRIHFRWGYEAVLEDEDGSLCGGGVPKKIYPDFGDSTPTACDSSCTGISPTGLPAAACPFSFKFHRLAFNNISPKSLEGKNLTITNSYGTSIGEFRTKRLTHKPGWMVVLVDGETYTLDWQNAENMTNVTFTGQLNELLDGDCLIFRLKVTEKPDIVSLDGANNDKTALDPFTCSSSGLTRGDWFYQDGYINVALIGQTPSRKKRGAGGTVFPDDLSLQVKIQSCFYAGCVTPPDPETSPPPTTRPSPFQLWSDPDLWEFNGTAGLRKASEKPDSQGLPAAGNDVFIPSGKWVVIKEYNTPKLGLVTIEGGLEIDYSTAYDYTFEARLIVIIGGRFVVGWQNNPIELGTVNIVLAGNKNSPMYTQLDGYEVGNKAIGVFGALELNGRDMGSSWVRLKQTAGKGATTLTVVDGSQIAKWRSGDKLIVTSTSSNPAETEERTIQSVNEATGVITLTSALTYRHSAGTLTVDGKDVFLGGAVGLLTRSIVVRGEVVSGEAHGGRIMASVTSVNNNLRTGYIRAVNTQFLHMGQDGYTESYDPRFALSFVATGTVSTAKPSTVTGCSFVELYNSAVGAFGIGELAVQNNVVYKPVGNGIVTSSDDTTLDRNLVANLLWTGSYNGRAEAFNIRYEAGIEAFKAKGLTLTNNYVSGSQRVGYHVPGEDCSLASPTYSYNYAAGNLMGVAVLPRDSFTEAGLSSCTKFSGFTTHKNYDFGIYYNNRLSLVVSNNIYADEQTALFPMVIGVGILSHTCGDEFVTVSDSIVIGQSSQSDCSQEVAASGTYLTLSSSNRGTAGPGSENLGILFPQITSGSNECPEKPCAGIMSYNTLCGKMTLKGNKFANFGPGISGCQASFAVATNPRNDDLQHQIFAENNAVFNVNQDYKIVIHRPNVDKINPADCVDMDCDALKKALLSDLDGSFMGSAGTVVPDSGWEWGGDPRRGLSDARVPKDMLTKLDGGVITVAQLAPNGKGIVRNSGCQFKQYSNFAYYWCPSLRHYLMAIESLDSDTETRRLSPVAILSDGYIDLINGPQDHGWCNGYTCQKRVSAFHALVLPEKLTTVYLSSTQPAVIRYFLLDAADDKCVIVSFYYLNPNRIDVYTNDGSTNIPPKNSVTTGNVFKLLNNPGVDYKPTCADPHGSNFIDRDARLLYFVIKGSNKIVLKRASVVIVSFSLPAMSEAEFFGANIIENLAAILNVPLNKVRLVKIVPANGSRRRRSTSGTTAVVEIGDQPTATSSEDTGAVTDYAALIMDSCQEGSISSNLGITGASCQEIVIGENTYVPTQPDDLFFAQELSPAHEGVPFTVQPKIRAHDTDGKVIAYLGIEEKSWEITASLRSCTPACGHPDAVLSGTLTVVSSNGWFNFTDLAISHKGDGYIIDFEVSAPETAKSMNLSIESMPFSVAAVPMTAGVYSMTSGDIVQGDTFSLTLDLRDSTTNKPIPDLTWRGHTAFDVTCGLVVSSETGTLTGTLSQSFDMATGRASFNDLSYTGYGLIYISCTVESTPAEFSFNSFHKVFVIGTHQINIPSEASQNIALRYNLDYDKTLTTEGAAAQLHQATLEHFISKYRYIIIRESTITRGSIIVAFTVEGGSMNVTDAMESICSEISSSLKITVGTSTLTLDSYMTVDGTNYYATCGKSANDDVGLHPAYIALIVILSVILIGVIIFVLVYKLKIKPKSKTHGIRKFSIVGYPDNGRTVFLAGSNQKIQDIFYKQRSTVGLKPESAAPITTLYDETPGYTHIRKSPLPPDYGERSLTPTGN